MSERDVILGGADCKSVEIRDYEDFGVGSSLNGDDGVRFRSLLGDGTSGRAFVFFSCLWLQEVVLIVILTVNARKFILLHRSMLIVNLKR